MPRATTKAKKSPKKGKAKPAKKGKAKPAKKPKDKTEKGEKKKRKPKKDPLRPKRNMSAFMFYSNARREGVKSENPDIKFTEIAKVIGAEWKDMSDRAKKQYQAEAAQDKVRYDAEMEKYTPAAGYTATGIMRGKGRKKDPNAPKRATSGYLFFCKDKRPSVREANPGVKMTDIAKLLAVEWNKASDKEKEGYNAKHAADKVRYLAQKEQYEKTGSF